MQTQKNRDDGIKPIQPDEFGKLREVADLGIVGRKNSAGWCIQAIGTTRIRARGRMGILLYSAEMLVMMTGGGRPTKRAPLHAGGTQSARRNWPNREVLLGAVREIAVLGDPVTANIRTKSSDQRSRPQSELQPTPRTPKHITCRKMKGSAAPPSPPGPAVAGLFPAPWGSSRNQSIGRKR